MRLFDLLRIETRPSPLTLDHLHHADDHPVGDPGPGHEAFVVH
jgi:hypothetical protein